MQQIFVSNGGDATSPTGGGGGGAAALTTAVDVLGGSLNPITLAAVHQKRLRFAMLAARHMVPPQNASCLYFYPDGQEIMWTKKLPPQSVLIDFFQVSPTSHLTRRDIRVIKLIDMTLKQLFSYDEFDNLKYKKQIFEYERRSYAAAELVGCWTEWARESVIHDYGIPPERTAVFRNGAVLDSKTLAEHRNPFAAERGDHLRLMFIGKDWRRKGLATLSQAVELVNDRGVAASILALGPEPSQISGLKHVEAAGFLDKSREMPRFVELIQSASFGVLWSRAEGLPNSLLEFLSFGVPVLTSAIPPIKSGLGSAAAIMIDPAASPDVIADALCQVWSDREVYDRLRRQAAAEAPSFTWLPSARRLLETIALDSASG